MKTDMIFLTIAVVALVGCVAAQTGLCPQASGDFPNPSSEQCTTFFRCVQGQPNLLRCPANQRFDFLFRVCRPQAQVDCNNQLQIYAAPNNDGGSRAGTGSALGDGPGGALDGGLGGILGGSLGAGLPQTGLINFLLRRGGNGGNSNNNQLALVAALGQLMNQRRAAASRAVVQQQRPQQTTVGLNQPVIPFYRPGDPFIPPPLPPQLNNLNVPIRPLITGNNAFTDPTAATSRAVVQQQRPQQTPVGFNQPVIPFYRPGDPFVPPPLLPQQYNLNVPIRPLITGNNAFPNPSVR